MWTAGKLTDVWVRSASPGTLTANRQAITASCVIGKSPKLKTMRRRSVFSPWRAQERRRRGLRHSL
jgi:hypothetical protein